jgi:hypothetical protein
VKHGWTERDALKRGSAVLGVRKSTLSTRCRKLICMLKQYGSTKTNHARSQTTPEARYLVTTFSRSLHPRGMTMGAPPQYVTPVCYEVLARVTASSHARLCPMSSYSLWLQQRPSSRIYKEPGYRVRLQLHTNH